MPLTVTGRHNTLTPALREHAEAKAAKLSRYFNLVESVEVVVDACRTGHKKGCLVEMIATTRHCGQFVVKMTGDAYAAVDACFRRLERALSDAKQKLRNPKHLVSARKLPLPDRRQVA